jgi:predicted metal-dependent HD superfamily phosphohydrolase
VQATASHTEAAGADEGSAGAADLAGFLDLDLAVLALPPERYDRYRRHIRAEYAHVPDQAFRTGRAAVLRKFADAPRLYRRAALRDALETAARENLRRELDALSRPDQPLLA